MTRPRKGKSGRRRGHPQRRDARRDDERGPRFEDEREPHSRQRDSHQRQHDSRQHPDDSTRPRDSRQQSGAPTRASAAAAEDASRVAARQARSRPLRELLEGIGTPEPAPFEPDPFQLEALAALESDDVLVTAPTGSGKTWIAREEIRRLLAAGKRAWYTSPLKALTNSKYHEFCDEFGAERVGILTGDRKEKSDAPLVVGTTEVYRNQLFDALRGGQQLQADLVVLDEAHYLADEERGHVWEEAIMLTPPRVRMLLLSATVGRAEEFADWIAEVRGTRVRVIPRPGARPVPLRAAFLYPDGGLTPLFDERGHFNQEIARFMQTSKSQQQSSRGRFGHSGRGGHGGQSRRPGLPEMPPSILLAALGSYDLLPAIVFLPTRRRCDEAAAEAAFAPRRGSSSHERREARRAVLERLVEQYPEMRRHRHWDIVLRGGVASHHAGHMPAWKLAIEQLMSAGLLDAIFATATVAAGVDFPARTVVLENVDVRTGHGWRALTASELQQMTGRAGRRGRDRVGFVVAAPGLHQNPQKLAALLGAEPDPLESQFRATYTTLLNLLDAYGTFAQVRDIAGRSFARRADVAELARLEEARGEAERRLRSKLAEAGCDLPAEVARGLERLASARSRLLEDAPQTRTESFMRWLDKEVVPGRVVGIGRGSRRLVFVTERRGDGLAGVRDNGRRVTLALERVGRVYEETYNLDERSREEAFEKVLAKQATPLREPRLRDARAESDEAVALINDLIESLSSDGGERARCEEALWGVVQEAETIERLERRAEGLRGEAWGPFERRARVLHHFGYLDFFAERVTENGRWLADLRLDRPLLVGETIGRGLFSSLDATRAAGLMAALAADAERDYGELELDDALITALARFDRIAYDVASVEWRHEIEPAPEINFSAAATAARWAAGVDWATLVRQTRAEEGDLFRMLSRTGESLLQISNLHESHPEAARIAEAAAAAILREPVRSEATI
ncbi:MAG TPA: DEAD/DEAH box helicase [Pyrinomonadaceae bacterium]|nr:DEAD/DEAH box helicase [Pyrinomonadaceae bacterium]